MKKNFLMVGAMLVAGTFLGAEVAKAADVSFGGQLRPRFEMNGRDFNDATRLDGQVNARIRLNANVKIDDKTSAFIQLQSVGVWGDNRLANTPANGNGNAGPRGSATGGTSASDRLSDVGFHQAYFTLKNFYDMPVDLKVGRQEIVLDGHRLFGHTGWTAGGQAHDALRLTHSHGDHTVGYIWSAVQETGNDNGDRKQDRDTHVLWGNFKGIGGGALSLYYVYFAQGDDGASARSTLGSQFKDNDFSTIGLRQAGKLGGIKYRGEFYYQFGDADGGAAQQTLNAGAWDRNAYMFGVRVGKQFGPVNITLWYDYLSGTDSSDVSSRDNGSFDTLFDTGHKFYGHMDRFLNVGLSSRGGSVQGDRVRGLGLQDFAVKAKMKVAPKWTVKGDLHFFWTAEDAFSANPTGATGGATATVAGNNGESTIGQELDLHLIHKYSKSTKIALGYSHFWTEDIGNEILGNDDADWAYVMMDVKF